MNERRFKQMKTYFVFSRVDLKWIINSKYSRHFSNGFTRDASDKLNYIFQIKFIK